MADAVTTITIVHQKGEPPASVAARLVPDNTQRALQNCAAEIEQIAGGVRGGKVTVRVDSSTGVAASATATMVQADGTVGDKMRILVPGQTPYVFTAVASGAVAANGEYSLATSDTAVAASLVLAILAVAGRHVDATSSVGVVTITAKRLGTWGNTIGLSKSVTTGTAITLLPTTALGSGYDHGARATATILCGTPDIVADDTITIGSVVLTWKASAANENEVTLSTTPATAATNLLAKINAHSKLQGIITATLATATITMTYVGPPRAGELVYLARTETNSGSVVLSGATFVAGSTDAYQAAALTVTAGQA